MELDSDLRVTFFMPTLGGGGAERVTVNLVQEFANRGFDIDLVLVRAEGAYLSEVPSAVRIIGLGASRILASLPQLVTYFREEQPDAFLSALESANIVALWAHRWAGSDARIVVATHNTLSVIARNARRLQDRVVPFLARRFYPWADGVVTVSEGAAEDLRRVANLPEDHVRVIYNPIVTPELLARTKEEGNHPWLQSKERPVVLGIGRLTSQKNFPLLLRAFAEVRRQREARLIILGEGEDRGDLGALAKRLDIDSDVDLPGFVDNPLAYLREASVFALSSNFEGLPTVLIEALACGCPIVSTNCPSGPEEILEGGQWGTLVPTGDKDKLAAAIIETIDSPRRSGELRERAQAFSDSRAVDQYLDVLLG